MQIHQREGDVGSDILGHFLRATLAAEHHFPVRWLPIRTARSYFSIFRNGFSSLTSIVDLVKQFLSLCMNHAIKFEVRQFPGSLDVFADTGSKDKPSVTDYCLDPDSGSDCVGLEGFVQT